MSSYGGGRHNNTHGDYSVQSTYLPPEAVTDPYDGHDAHLTAADVETNPFLGSLAGPAETQSHDDYVPAVDHTAFTLPGTDPSFTAPSSSTVIPFQDSNLPSHAVHGKVGPSEVPRVHSYSDAQNLFLGGHQAASAPAGEEPAGGAQPQNFGWFSLKRFRKHFNVDTEDVLERIRDSVIGSYKADFMEKVRDNADLYGPFWVATTLIFVSAVTGNYASYASHVRHAQSATTSDETGWYYDVNKVGYSAILFYGYVGLGGLILFGALNWFFKANVGLAQVWCTYGYSLSVFIPMAFICIFPYEWLRWTLVMAATATSGLFLVTNFRTPISEAAGTRAAPVLLAIVLAHVGLGLAMKLYFFQYW